MEKFSSGQKFIEKDSALSPMLQSIIEKGLEAGMEGHLDSDERYKCNKRYGEGKKDH